MTKTKDVIKAIDRFAPFAWSCEWDNPGLQAGSPEWAVSGVAVSLDATEKALSEALEQNCSCLVVHHPMVFEPLRSIQTQTVTGGRLLQALDNRISVIAAHTNWDVSPCGVNPFLGEKLGLTRSIPLEEGPEGSWGTGLCGYLMSGVQGNDLVDLLCERWNLSWARSYNLPKSPSRVALVGGSGGDMWPLAFSKGADVFITADMKYHQVMDAVKSGLGVIIADHGEMERPSIPALKEMLENFLPVKIVEVDKKGFDPGEIIQYS
ncbi:MAG TPA: Nif3-like dinuclear metal center hexameric protein [Synergistetes bacterium]|nr:Nif3-like dinuclear metal center hexameric protein [Synergistota bacterium]